MGWNNLCYLGLPSALSGICSLTATIAPSYCDNGKISFSISQISPGMEAGVTNRLEVGGDPGHGVLDPATVCKKKLNLNVFWLIIHCPACHSFFTFMLLA